MCGFFLDAYTASARAQNWRSTTKIEKLNNCAIRLPKKENKLLSFGSHYRKKRVPFVVYPDLTYWKR